MEARVMRKEATDRRLRLFIGGAQPGRAQPWLMGLNESSYRGADFDGILLLIQIYICSDDLRTRYIPAYECSECLH